MINVRSADPSLDGETEAARVLDPATVVISDLFIQAWGRKPNRRETSKKHPGDGGHHTFGS